MMAPQLLQGTLLKNPLVPHLTWIHQKGKALNVES